MPVDSAIAAARANWKARAARAPLALACPLCSRAHLIGVATRYDITASGARYRCRTCGLTFVIALAILDKTIARLNRKGTSR